MIDHAFTTLGYEVLQAGARVTNPASRRVLEKCGFQWTGVGLYRIRALVKLGADRPLPPRPRHLGLAQELGQGEAGGVTMTGECLFCRIARRASSAHVFHEDAQLIAFLVRAPITAWALA